MKRLLILLIIIFNQNISTIDWDWSKFPRDIKKTEIAGKLLEEAVSKAKSAKNLKDLSDAMKDLKNFSLTSKENNKIFQELVDIKLPQLDGESLKTFVQKKKQIFDIPQIKNMLKTQLWITDVDWLTDIDSKDSDGQTALMLATLSDDENVVKSLIERGANLNIKNEKSGKTALHYAVDRNEEEIAKLLINSGADTTIQDNNGKTAYDIANNRQFQNIINLFVNKTGN